MLIESLGQCPIVSCSSAEGLHCATSWKGGLRCCQHGFRLLPMAPAEGYGVPGAGYSTQFMSTLDLHRALEGGLEMLPNGFRLLPVAPAEGYKRLDRGIVVTAIFAAVESNPVDKFSIGALGQWLPAASLLQQVGLCKKLCLTIRRSVDIFSGWQPAQSFPHDRSMHTPGSLGMR